MKTVKISHLLLLFAFLFSVQVWGQQTSPSTAAKQGNKAATKQMNLDSLKAVSMQKARPTKKNDIPEIPMTNARITYDYTHFDYGNVPGGSKVTHNFPVKNTGPDTLIITKIKPG
jgi:hypothetical protein